MDIHDHRLIKELSENPGSIYFIDSTRSVGNLIHANVNIEGLTYERAKQSCYNAKEIIAFQVVEHSGKRKLIKKIFNDPSNIKHSEWDLPDESGSDSSEIYP